MTDLAYGDAIIAGKSGYASAVALHAAWKAGQVSRAWHLGVRIVSIKMAKIHGGGLWKCKERLPLSDPYPMLDALESVGVSHPSSFADCYHQLAPRERILPYTYNGMFTWWPGGPWEEAKREGEHKGIWNRYDLVSAYRWAATAGLPDPETYEAIERPIPPSRPGLWMYAPTAKAQAREDLPAVYKRSSQVVLSTEEIEGYGITGRVIRGVTWSKTLPGDYVDRTLNRLPCAKQSGRAYWGRWIARDRLQCWTANKEWALPNIGANMVWGWLIVGRVRYKVWEDASEAAHVYVDELVVPHTLTTGQAAGSWHLKETYPKGIQVKRTGHFGPLHGPPSMTTGVQRAG